MIIGSHVGMKAPNYVLGAVEEALTYNCNALMIYTGAPQNTTRKPIESLKISEAHALLQQSNISINNLIVHAPYIINLANTVNANTRDLAISFLKEEIKRTIAIGSKYLVLHPGSHVKAGYDVGIQGIIDGLNSVLEEDDDIVICLETMAGKGSECGLNFQQLKQIIDGVNLSDKIGVCADTCHLHDSGYDLNDIDSILMEFDQIIGLDRLKVIHLNDSKNKLGARKDRHENIGYGFIGFKLLAKIANHPQLIDIPKILETPYIDKLPPYEQEIEMLKCNNFYDWKKENNA